MTTFQRLCEALEKYKENRDDPRMNAYNSQNNAFWDNLSRIASGGNIEGLSELLHIPSNQIRKWPALIRQAKQEYEDQQAQNKKDIMMPTGKTGSDNGKTN